MGVKKNLAVFISGHGSNLEVILQNKEKFDSLFVVSSNPKAFGLERADNHGVPSYTLSKPIDWESLQAKLIEKKIEVIFLAGFMRIVPASFTEKWQGRLFNLHPSMLPKFKGLKAIERAVEAGEDVGVSIHHVVPEVDGGEVVLQKIAVASSSLSQLSLDQVVEKTHKVEHELVQSWVNQISEQ